MRLPMNAQRAHDRAQFVLYGITVGRSAFSLLRGQLAWLRHAGWRVELATSPDDGARSASAREGVVLHPIAMSREISPVADLRALVNWLGLILRLRPDVVNVSTPKAGLLGGLAAWIARVPRRVYVVRGLRVEGAQGYLESLLSLMERLTMMMATDVIFVSRSLAQEADRRRLFPDEKSWLIGSGSSNGVNSEAIAKRVSAVDRDELRSRLGFDQRDFVVGYIGRVTPDKGVDTLVAALLDDSIDPRARLLVVGPVEDEALDARVQQLGKRVCATGWTDDVWGHLPAIDVLSLPTLREGFPNVVLEAAAAGIPTITTRATGAIDSVVDGETGYLLDIGDSAALTERINGLAADPALRQRLGSAASSRVESEFKPEIIWQGISEILAGQPNPTHAARLSRNDWDK